ncbi:MAG: hypothetical protein IT290_01435, partial [Deltaproteobacteria bacterium]|nr:hypothetical protein [Deltaproteobacteria bacterium]
MVLPLVGAILLGIYVALFVQSVADYWFNPVWTTDDALQQLFPLFSALEPRIFEG